MICTPSRSDFVKREPKHSHNRRHPSVFTPYGYRRWVRCERPEHVRASQFRVFGHRNSIAARAKEGQTMRARTGGGEGGLGRLSPFRSRRASDAWKPLARHVQRFDTVKRLEQILRLGLKKDACRKCVRKKCLYTSASTETAMGCFTLATVYDARLLASQTIPSTQEIGSRVAEIEPSGGTTVATLLLSVQVCKRQGG